MRRGAVVVAIAAAVGNFLQGWDNSSIAGSVIYIKKEFNYLETHPAVEGLIVAMSLIGGTLITTLSGPVSDSVGRRPMLIASSLLYLISSLIMLWAPNVYVLLLARLLDGFGIGIAVTLVPVYISETAPCEIRGQLNTIPQFAGSTGMFISYCMVFAMSLSPSSSSSSNWRLMLGILCFPSILYLALTVFFLPESPRWLVTKGRFQEAQKVLQRLRARDDVSGELALLVEGLNVGVETSIQEYVMYPDNSHSGLRRRGSMDPPSVHSMTVAAAKPVGQSNVVNRSGSGRSIVHLMDPIVPLFGSFHDSPAPRTSSIFSTFFGMGTHGDDMDDLENNDQFDDYDHNNVEEDYDCETPLLSREPTGIERENTEITAPSSFNSRVLLVADDLVSRTEEIGSGWQMAWKVAGDDGTSKKDELQRIFLHHSSSSPQGSYHDSRRHHNSSSVALISRSVLSQDIVKGMGMSPMVITNLDAPKHSSSSSSWNNLFEAGTKRALTVGIGLQILQQVSGINGVLYYGPQILKQAGVALLLSSLGLNSDSSSLLISCIIALSMLPCIGVSMRLMDVSGRRSLLLSTIPILVVSLFALILSSVVSMEEDSFVHAIISTVSVMVYLSCFVMGFGVIPNILCAEIFPTKVRGLCITICSLTYWVGNILITYSLPVLLSTIGVAGLFTIYALGCAVSWVFVFLKVPETKGMPLEVITDFFAAGSTRQQHQT